MMGSLIFNKWEIWLVNLHPAFKNEPGKVRPALIIQTDFINKNDPGTVIICPITTNIISEDIPLRTNLLAGDQTGLEKMSAILLDQLRAIDKSRLVTKVGRLPSNLENEVNFKLKLILDLE